MDTADQTSPLARKIAAHRPDPAEAAFSPDGALFTALARVAERQLHLPLALQGGGLASRTGPEIAELLPDRALVMLVEGPQGVLGVAVLDQGGLSALSEQMMLGHIGAQPPEPRRPTRTDAVMMAGVLDAVLAEFDGLIADEAAAVWGAGFRYGAHLADPRPLALMLEEPLYLSLRLSLAFGDAPGREGALLLVVPAQGRGALPAPPAAARPSAQPAESLVWGAPLARAVERVEAEVHAVLARISLPLADLLTLEEGHSVPLPRQALHMVQLEGADGRLICLAHLGQGQGHRALRLKPPDDGTGQTIGLPVAETVLIPASEQPLARGPAPPRALAEDDPLAADLAGAGPPPPTAQETAA